MISKMCQKCVKKLSKICQKTKICQKCINNVSKNCQKHKSDKNVSRNSPKSDKNVTKYKNVFKICQLIFQKSIKKLTKVCLLTHFCYFVAVIFGIILVQNVSKNWQIMRWIVGSILPILTYFWYISANSPSTYKLQKLSKMCQIKISTLQKCIKKVTKVCLLTNFCHIFGISCPHCVDCFVFH